MWYIVKTNNNQEQEAADFLLSLDGIEEVYSPINRRKADNTNNNIRFEYSLKGLLFINVESVEALRKLINLRGYFKAGYTDNSKAHLLCALPKGKTLDEIISGAHIPNGDMRCFRICNEHITDVDNIMILDSSYKMLEQNFDTIEIVNGPFAGLHGVIKQVRQKDSKYKDHRMFFRMGAWSVCIPDVRKYHHIFVREATKGKRAEEVNAWRHIDQLIGRLQASSFTETAATQLRAIIDGICQKQDYENYLNSIPSFTPLHKFLTTLTLSDKNSLLSLAQYFIEAKNANLGIKALIPDVSLRPFLTPTSGIAIPDNQEFALLQHKDFIEMIVRMNLDEYFHDNQTYFAHIGLFQSQQPSQQQSATGAPLITAIVNWGGFYSSYSQLTDIERKNFHESLQNKGYILTSSIFDNYRFKRITPAIGGFCISIEMPDDITTLFAVNSPLRTFLNHCAAAAAELWQGTRMMTWRKLMQRHVLLHKIPPTL